MQLPAAAAFFLPPANIAPSGANAAADRRDPSDVGPGELPPGGKKNSFAFSDAMEVLLSGLLPLGPVIPATGTKPGNGVVASPVQANPAAPLPSPNQTAQPSSVSSPPPTAPKSSSPLGPNIQDDRSNQPVFQATDPPSSIPLPPVVADALPPSVAGSHGAVPGSERANGAAVTSLPPARDIQFLLQPRTTANENVGTVQTPLAAVGASPGLPGLDFTGEKTDAATGTTAIAEESEFMMQSVFAPKPEPRKLSLESSGQAPRASSATSAQPLSHGLEATPQGLTNANQTERLQHGPVMTDQTKGVASAQTTELHQPARTEIHVRLDPPELGPVRVHLSSHDDQVSGRMMVADEAVRVMMESQLLDLRHRLEQAGIALGRFDVARDDNGQGSRGGERPASHGGLVAAWPKSSSPAAWAGRVASASTIGHNLIDLLA